MESYERTGARDGASAPKTVEWPALPLAAWQGTCETLHRYVQIVGKVQLATTPLVNHFWNVAFSLTGRGLSTSPMPYEGRTFEIEFDFVDHAVALRTSDGRKRVLPLLPRSVAHFYAELMASLESLGIRVRIWDHPVELASESIPLSRDNLHAEYDPEWAARFWQVLTRAGSVLSEFRGRFIGKASPVGFYWGTFDLCAARYSGRRAKETPANTIEREAYSHELSEAGFWPGDVRYPEPAFFALHAPAPEGYARASVQPGSAFWHPPMNCFLLPYEIVRTSQSPRATLLDFFESTYRAGANLAGWDRAELERHAA